MINMLNVLGILSVPVSIYLLAVLLSPENTATGGGLAWFLIFSVMTGGLLLLFTLLSFGLTIRIVWVFFAWLF